MRRGCFDLVLTHQVVDQVANDRESTLEVPTVVGRIADITFGRGGSACAHPAATTHRLRADDWMNERNTGDSLVRDAAPAADRASGALGAEEQALVEIAASNAGGSGCVSL